MNRTSRHMLGLAALLFGLLATAACNRREPLNDERQATGSSAGSSGSSGSGATSDASGATSSGSSERSSVGAAARATGNAAADTLITGKVKAALLADSDLKSLGIAVETNDAEVTLSGALTNQVQIDRAVKLAAGVSGVRSVRNQLAIQR